MADTVTLPGALGHLAPLLDHYGYLAIAAVVMVEDFGIPVPGETILVAGAVYAGAGQLNILAVATIAFVAAVVGDNIGYAIGHYGGRRLVARFGRYVLLTDERLARVERFFGRHGGKIVTVARFVEGLRQANGLVAGTSHMPWRRFLTFNALGAALWVAVWASLGYLAGDHIATIYEEFGRYQRYLLVGLVVLAAALVGWHVLRNRRTRAAADR